MKVSKVYNKKHQMKYIFRYTLLNNFPNKDNKITEEELSEALQSVKFQLNKYDLNYLQQLCLNCVDKFFTRPQDKIVTVIEDVFGSASKPVPQFNGKELQNIWQQQKVNIYKSIINSSCRSSYCFKDMEWSVKNVIMRRNQSLGKGSNMVTEIKVNTLQREQCDGKVGLYINASGKGFERMFNSLQECQNEINQVLLSEQ